MNASSEPWDLDSLRVLGESQNVPGGLAPGLFDGRFEVRERLGQGAMGVVYRAWDPSLDREVAIKVVRGACTPAQRARFARECELAGSLRHPGIVAVHGAGEVSGAPYLVSELVWPAKTLNEVLPWLERSAQLAMIRDVARALGHAHGQGVVHRDVKPGNILVDGEGRVRLTDFGLATSVGVTRLTQSEALVGTPSHMSPEQLTADRGACGPPSDVWAVGVILYEALVGEHPFQSATLLELSTRVLSGPPPSLRSIDRSVSASLDALTLRALRRDPSDRFPHGDALADALDAALSESGARAPRRHWVALALALVGVGVGAWAATRSRPGEVAPGPAVAAASPTAGPLPATPEPEPAGSPTPGASPAAALPPVAFLSVSDLRARVAANPSDWDARATLARELIPPRPELGQPAPAVGAREREAARHIKAVLESDGRASDQGRAIALHARSTLRGRLGDFTGALADLRASLALDPTPARLWHHRAFLEARAGDLVAAGKSATKAIARGGLTPQRLGEVHALRALAREQATGDTRGAASDHAAAARLLEDGNPLKAHAVKRAAALRSYLRSE